MWRKSVLSCTSFEKVRPHRFRTALIAAVWLAGAMVCGVSPASATGPVPGAPTDSNPATPAETQPPQALDGQDGKPSAPPAATVMPVPAKTARPEQAPAPTPPSDPPAAVPAADASPAKQPAQPTSPPDADALTAKPGEPQKVPTLTAQPRLVPADVERASEAASANRERLASIVNFVIAHAPYKQIDAATGSPNVKIGRAPASACEVMRFLTFALLANGADQPARTKLNALADWVIGLQVTDRKLPHYGGVPSTPDLQPPANQYYYTIDGAVCADAMFHLHRLSGDARHLASARAFADFLVSMHVGPGGGPQRARRTGFCELVAILKNRPAWVCDVYVKNLLALPPLQRIAEATSTKLYGEVAAEARAFLLPGLEGLWEFATAGSARQCTAKTCKPDWRRVQGPHREPNHFVYGDTLAYALRGLYESEGASDTVTKLYRRFASFKGQHERTTAYDGRIALAGYIIASTAAPDHFSGYYDLVTLGILHDVRRAAAPQDVVVANAALAALPKQATSLSWRMNFDGTLPKSEFVDLTTLGNIGEALLSATAAAKK